MTSIRNTLQEHYQKQHLPLPAVETTIHINGTEKVYHTIIKTFDGLQVEDYSTANKKMAERQAAIKVLKQLGYREEDFLGDEIEAKSHPDYKGLLLEHYKRKLSPGEVREEAPVFQTSQRLVKDDFNCPVRRIIYNEKSAIIDSENDHTYYKVMVSHDCLLTYKGLCISVIVYGRRTEAEKYASRLMLIKLGLLVDDHQW